MKLSIVFEGLEKLVRRMGASPRPWSPDSVSRKPPEIPAFVLIEMELEGDTSMIERDSEKGTFVKDGRAVVLYIKDTRCTAEQLADDPSNGPKYHLLDCRTIQEMTERGRFERYVITNSRTGLFKVGTVAEMRSRKRGGEVKVPLKVCKNCLKVLYPGLTQSQRNSLCEQFNLAEFLDSRDEKRFLRLPSRHADDAFDHG